MFTEPSPTSLLLMMMPGLNDVAWHDLGLQAGVDYLDIHAAFRELAALKVHSLHILQDGKDDARNIKVGQCAGSGLLKNARAVPSMVRIIRTEGSRWNQAFTFCASSWGYFSSILS